MADYDIYVGIDWATETHQVCVVDARGDRCEQWKVAHSGAGLAELEGKLQALMTEPARIAVGLETPRGAVVDTLLEIGCHVFAVNPKHWTGFEIATPWRGPRTIGGMRSSSPTPCARTAGRFAGSPAKIRE
jgi:hypothetical protein